MPTFVLPAFHDFLVTEEQLLLVYPTLIEEICACRNMVYVIQLQCEYVVGGYFVSIGLYPC